MRESVLGLLVLVQRVLAERGSHSGDRLAFVSRRRNYIKILAWDRTGFMLYAKKVKRGRFLLPRKDVVQEVSEKFLRHILDGIALAPS